MIDTECVHYSHGVKMSKMTTMKTSFIPSDFLSYVLSFILSLVLFFFLSLKIQNHECAEGSPYVPTVAVPYRKMWNHVMVEITHCTMVQYSLVLGRKIMHFPTSLGVNGYAI